MDNKLSAWLGERNLSLLECVSSRNKNYDYSSDSLPINFHRCQNISFINPSAII